MDAFFAAIEERENPRFKGLPIAVGSDPKGGHGRGIVSTANYEARGYGIHSALPITRAWKFSEEAFARGKPRVIFLPVNSRLYSEVSGKIIEILRAHVKILEQASIDEAYLDLSFLGNYQKAEELALKIKREIKEKEKLTASVGIGPNKLIAKIASSKNKPDGLTIITPGKVMNFLRPLSIREIPGIGPKTEALLNRKNIFSVSDLQKMTKAELIKLLDKWGEDLFYKSRGVSDSEVTQEYEIKSIGEQETFEKDTLNLLFINECLAKMADRVIRRMRSDGFESFKTVTLIIRFSDFDTRTRSHTLKTPVNDLTIFRREAMKLLLPFFDKRENPNQKMIRLVGLRIEKLS